MKQTTTEGLILVDKPFWVTAVVDGEFLCVYRSVLVHDTDPVLQPVNDLLNRHDNRVVTSVVGRDDNMMFGQGVATIYRIGERLESAS